MWRITSEITDEITKKKNQTQRSSEQIPATISGKKGNSATDSKTLIAT